jgi:hypothetical protein
VHAERGANGTRGPSLHKIRQCQTCRTVSVQVRVHGPVVKSTAKRHSFVLKQIWNRDVNAARNIGFLFWFIRVYGRRPPSLSPRRGALEPLLANRPELSDENLAELLCLIINRLPLNGRPDLQKLSTRIGLDTSPDLIMFITQRRQALEQMVDAEVVVVNNKDALDDNHLDFRYALGLGCQVQFAY